MTQYFIITFINSCSQNAFKNALFDSPFSKKNPGGGPLDPPPPVGMSGEGNQVEEWGRGEEET